MSFPLKRIITALDFSPHSQQALGYGIALTLRFDAELYLFHSLFGPQDTFHNIDINRRPQGIARQTEEAREQMQALMESSPVAWRPLICNGPPVETIAGEAAHLKADLVVAAGHGLSVLQKLFLGRVVDPMARTLACPLLIVRKDEQAPLDLARPAGFKNIVAACTLRDDPDPVTAIGLSLAQAYGAELHLFHSLEAPLDETAVNPTSAPYSEVQQALYSQRLEALQALIPPQTREVCRTHAVVQPGMPAENLAGYCRKTRPDLIIVGVRRRSLMKKLMVGSTTEAILHQHKAHVLTVPLATPPANGREIG